MEGGDATKETRAKVRVVGKGSETCLNGSEVESLVEEGLDLGLRKRKKGKRRVSEGRRVKGRTRRGKPESPNG